MSSDGTHTISRSLSQDEIVQDAGREKADIAQDVSVSASIRLDSESSDDVRPLSG